MPQDDSRVLTALAGQVRRLADEPRNERLRALWHAHNLGRRQGGFRPVFVNMKPGHYPNAWTEIAALKDLTCAEPLEREVEWQLRQILWRARHIRDDYPVYAVVVLPCRMPSGWEAERMFGPPIRLGRSDDTSAGLTAVRFDGCLESVADIRRIIHPLFTYDAPATAEQVEKARELTAGLIDVKVVYDKLSCNPFEWAMRLRGMEKILYDFVDNPELLEPLLDVVTEGHVRYHKQREQSGTLDPFADTVHIHAAYTRPAHGPPHKLAESWCYISAQSAGVVSPEMYARFVQPYNVRLAELFGYVYYHGCEDLTKKAALIGQLPHLRRFHVSPWSNCAAIAAALPSDITFEVTVNNTDHLFTYSDRRIIDDVKRLADEAGEHPFDMNLSDIETVARRPELLTRWVDLTRQALG